MKIIKLNLLLALLTSATLFSCGQESTTVNNNSSSSDSSTSTSTDTSSTSGSCAVGKTGDEAGISTNGQSIEYYKIPFEEVVMHGASQGVVTFNSQLHLSSEYGDLLKTDSRLNVRIIPKEITKGTFDSQGNECTKQGAAWPFTKLNLKMVIRPAGGSSSQSHTFTDVPLNCASDVHEFDLTHLPTNQPFVIEISNATNDQDCLEDQTKTGRQDYCPYHIIGSQECYGLEIQFSTDNTKDIPH